MKTSLPVSSLRQASVFRGASIGLAMTLMVAAPAFAAKYASIVVDMDTAQVLHSKNADDPRYPASLTKVMTLYIVFDALESGKLKLTDKMKVSKFASRQSPSKLGLKAGATIKVEDAIRALVTKSANDVAVVFAEHMSGSEAKFAVRMTNKAHDLGLDHTTFKNASGLPNKAQVSTARDLSKLAEAMFFDHKEYYNYFSTPEFTWRKRHFANHNTLLKSVDGVDGIKTGFTNASGYNLMASAQREGHRVIAVMLGGSSGRSRDAHVADLLNAAFYEINGKGDAPEAVALMQKIAFGEVETVEPVYATVADRLAAGQLKQLASADSTEEGDEGPGDDADAPEGEDTSAVENDDADTPTPKPDPLAGNLLKAAAPAPAAPIVAAPTLVAAPAPVTPAIAAPTLVAAPVASSLTVAPIVEKAGVQASAPLPSLAPPAAAPALATAATITAAAPAPSPVAAAAPAAAPIQPPVFQGPVLEHPASAPTAN